MTNDEPKERMNKAHPLLSKVESILPWRVWLFVILNAAFVLSSQAQWRTETYSLKGGWNSIYLHGDAVQDTIDNLMPVV